MHLVSARERCVSCVLIEEYKTNMDCMCRRRVDPEEEAAERASSGEDEFYDRTAPVCAGGKPYIYTLDLTLARKRGVSCMRRRRVDPEEVAAERASSDEDEFYDRTADGRAKKLRAKDAPALDAATLYGRKVLCTIE